MKKFLSLALALIMALSLVTVSAGATFTDAEAINNTEAVEVMAALGILEGSDGSFNPQGTLTRGAAAKIIAYMVEGTAKADAIKAAGVDEKPFPDVPTTSATAPFIAWAAEKDIVGGYSDGTFQRSNPVTGNAFVKMVLKALGVTDIDFTAKGWQIDAIARAVEMDLLEGIDEDVDFSKNLTRENAAQLAFNAMQYVPEGNKYWYVGTVKFETATDAAIYAALAGGTPEQKADLTKSLAGKNYKMAYDTICVASTPETVAGQKTTKASNGAEYKTAASKELVGHIVNVWFKDADGDGVYDYSATAAETVYAVADLSTEVVVSADKKGLTADGVEALLGIKDVADAEAGFVAMGSDDTVTNYVFSSAATSNLVKYESAKKGLTVVKGTYIIYNETILAYKTASTSVKVLTVTINDADKGYYTVNDGTTDIVKVVEKADECVNKSLTEIDWVGMVEEGKTSAKAVYVATQVGQFYSYAAPTVVTGTVTKVEDVKTSAGAESTADLVYIDGVKYTMAANATAAAEIKGAAAITLAAVKFEEYNFYLDGTGKIFAFASTDEAAVATDPSLIIPVYVYSKTSEVKPVKDEYGTVTNADKVGKFYTIWVQAIDMTGEVVNLQVVAKTKYTADSEVTAAVTGAFTASDLKKFHTYTTLENEDGEAISTITKVTTSTTKAHDYVAAGITDTAKKLTIGNKDYYMTEGFQVIYLTGTGADVEVVIKEGTNDQIVAGSFAYGVKKAEDTAFELKYILVNAAAGTSVAGEELAFVKGTFSTKVAVPYTKADGTIGTAYEQTFYVNGEKKTAITTTAQGSVVTGAGFYTYEVDELGLYTFKALTTEEAAQVVVGDTIDSIYKGMITINGTAVIDVDVTGAKLVNLVSSTAANYSKIPTDPAKLAATETISFVLNEDGDAVELIYITASSRSAS